MQPSRYSTRTRVKSLAMVAPILATGAYMGRSSAASQSDDPVTLTVWLFEGEEQLLPALKEAYEAANPNVTIEITLIPEDQYTVKIDTALAAGNPPDIGYLQDDRWVKTGNILALNDTMESNGIDLANFNQAIMQGSCIVDEQVNCVGSYVGAVVLMYNRDMFDAAGVEYPSATEPLTIDEYAALAEQLSVMDDDINNRVWGGSSGSPYWWMNRTTMVSEDGREAVEYVNDDSTKHAYEVLAGMVTDGHAPSSSVAQALGAEGDNALFIQGKLAMSITGFSNLATLEEAGISYGVATLPVEQAGDPPYLPVWTDEMAVFSGSEHPEQAMDFVAFVATEGQRLRVEVTGEAPLNSSAAEELGWAEQGANAQARQEFLDAVSSAEPPLFVPSFLNVVSPLEDAFNRIVEGDASASEALDEVAPRIQDNLDQAWETWDRLD